MSPATNTVKPTVGMAVTFKSDSSPTLAGIPARISFVWPRFRTGDYLVTLEYAEPVKFRNALIKHIDAFISELEQPTPIQHFASTTAYDVTVEARPLVQLARGA
jgi:hypothetical protein